MSNEIDFEAISTDMTEIGPSSLKVRGISVEAIIEGFRLEDVVALVFGLELDEADQEVLRACLVANPDHGKASNAVTAAVSAAATARDGLAPPLAAGLLAVGTHTISPRTTMVFLAQAVERWKSSGEEIEPAARSIVDQALASGQRLPGYGSPLHPLGDPRVSALSAISRRVGRWGDSCSMYVAIENALEHADRAVLANEVGMVAACLADIGLSPEEGEAVSLIATVPAILANILLEWGEPPRFLIAMPPPSVLEKKNGD